MGTKKEVSGLAEVFWHLFRFRSSAVLFISLVLLSAGSVARLPEQHAEPAITVDGTLLLKNCQTSLRFADGITNNVAEDAFDGGWCRGFVFGVFQALQAPGSAMLIRQLTAEPAL